MRSRFLREPLSRRALLRGVMAGSTVAVGLPWLEAMAATCTTGFPKRFGTFTWGNGNLPDRWVPATTGPSFELSEQLAPLAASRAKITVCSGLELKVPNVSPHWSGGVAYFTGQPLVGNDDNWTVQAPTVDQVVAQTIGGDTLYRSLQIGIADDRNISWAGPNSQLFGETDPYALFERLFGPTFREPGSAVDPSIGRRRSVLDVVLGDLDRLQPHLSAADRLRLDQHTSAVRDLELRLARLEEDPPDLAACRRADAPPGEFPDVLGRPQLSARSRAMSDLLALCLACDQTRVFSFGHHTPLSNVLFPDAPDGHHNLTHDEASPQPQVHAIVLQVMEELAYLLAALDAIPEGDQTLLDHALVLAGSEISEGRTHRLDEMPVLLAGGACGSVPMGHHLRSEGRENLNHMMLTLLNAMDVPASSWGKDDTLVETGWGPLEGA